MAAGSPAAGEPVRRNSGAGEAADKRKLPPGKTPPPTKRPTGGSLRRSAASKGYMDDTEISKFSYFSVHIESSKDWASSSTAALPCEWSRAGQHTLTWTETLKAEVGGKEVLLKPGTVNMYKFPAVKFRHFLKDEPPEQLKSERLELLMKIMYAILQEERELFELPDASGATALLALGVANTKEAVTLSMSLYKREPTLLLQAHYPGPFFGENVLHVLVVNQREEELCTLIELAADHLSRPDLERVFWSQAEGGFFRDAPMCDYGSTILSYASTFCMRRAVATMLLLSHKGGKDEKFKGLLDLNNTKHACKLTGFMPVHVVVANSRPTMYDFLIDLPGMKSMFAMRANDHLRSMPGTFASLTPLQLACKLGDHKMFQHIMRRHSAVVWKWGPVTQYQIDLEGIDSSGTGGNDVMELIGRLDARKETQEMLLDSFIQGFIHKIFIQKWERFGRRVHNTLMGLQAAFILALASMALWLKEDPEGACGATWLPIVIMLMMLPILEEDLRSVILYHERLSKYDPERWTHLYQWANSNLLLSKLLGMVLATVACVALLCGYRPHGYTDVGGAPAANSSQLLAAFGEVSLVGGEHDEIFPMWAILALSLLIFVQAFFGALLAPFQRLGVFFHTSFKMIANDISIFLVLFSMFLFNYGFAMYICYPRAGSVGLPYVPHFNYFLGATAEMLELAVAGDPIKLYLDQPSPETTAMWIEMVLFFMLYIVYTLFTLVLLLNLLIAMMGSTFTEVQGEAIREWRVLYARNILRLEMLAETLSKPPFELWSTRGGEEMNGRYYVFSRTQDDIDTNASSSAIFDNPGGDHDDDAGLIDDVADLREMAAVNIQKLYRGRKGRSSLRAPPPPPQQGGYKTFGKMLRGGTRNQGRTCGQMVGGSSEREGTRQKTRGARAGSGSRGSKRDGSHGSSDLTA